ncbi:hypothetical protein GCM10010191_39810 [Actinomadura vinacea]|uniref:non-specific serine/threonine protein kinase n=1 Tax=Actinomadura vinacea TaxID=115336 RepID=A0ABN3J796_9ACTN
MIPRSAARMVVQPLVGWPRTVTPGQAHLVTVDLRAAEGQGWPYEEEEFAFPCMLDGAPHFTVEAVSDPSVILHRFGGSYGPARFVVTAAEALGEHVLWLNVATQNSALVYAAELAITVVPARAEASGGERIGMRLPSTGPAESELTRTRRLCPNCNEPVGVGVAFCENCGISLDTPQAPAPSHAVGRAGEDFLVVVAGDSEITTSLALYHLTPPFSLDSSDALRDATRRAGSALGGAGGQGTSATMMRFDLPGISVAHIGDTRAYMLRDAELSLITQDHVVDLLERGEGHLHPERERRLPRLEDEGDAEPDLLSREAQLGDRYLVCSPGLWRNVPVRGIFEVLSRTAFPQAAADALVRRAAQQGGGVGIACVIGDVQEERASRWRRGRLRLATGVAHSTGTQAAARTGAPSIPGYELFAWVGRGMFGEVWRGRDAQGRDVAVRLIRPGATGSDRVRQRLARDIDTARGLRSDHVDAQLDADVTGPRPYIVTRFVSGLRLGAYIDEWGPLPEGLLQHVAIGLARALADVHAAGLVHRDVRPGEVLIDKGEPVLTGLGLAALMDAGTQGFPAPEVLQGEEAGPAADVFAWACTVVQAATGRPPFPGTAFKLVYYETLEGGADLAGVPAWLDPVVRAALAVDPGDRPTAAELVERLRDRE